MIKKVLIANRGEIARRIIRTCKQLGIQTVAVYSDADQNALFKKDADEAYHIGPSQVQKSYLQLDKIMEVAEISNVDAIHPGYGFLSESPTFAERCREENIIFIGPEADILRLMGSKIEARKAMIKAGVPVIPGTDHAVDSARDAVAIAEQIGYPVMLKASAGGGGIGMEVVHSAAELQKAFENNSKRAETFFGDGAMFLEKHLQNSRHIEVQVLADHHGNTVHLFERECSIQRRNQKVLEEAPSPAISEELRVNLGKTAVKAAEAIHYTNAGTIEFLVDEKEHFYFLEMNTRIQVEHPITEEITGIDIVKEQINIANNQVLPFQQDEIQRNGHAIEVRIYAEDPIRFFPSPGTITRLELPKGEGVRNECAVTSGDKVTPFYDPMVAKLVVYGENRSEAIDKLKETLHQFKVEGIKTNIPMLQEIITYEAFIEGDTQTSFLRKYYQPTTGGN
ncbi:acetyl-CoA carboxylase biotin carboxylase subunit [Oceanobacillus sp. J11TS1]|uniref:acetyl-CoA carboxylase biotin carboxylase subunit n=1 Tax=Oceanobacillus sp. J11TS1 TaxID=2807191 RepID=UPI001B2887EE|nr:acetyl-CoA carboxylase biotin carboxylase subunit [Oceanobacillus sp. J11TS1]GIO23210.1 biotin carboxylase 2 [Oceanobacillus sp. J11TS1]